jgi:xanthine dehydrogenase accessory factor
MGTGAGHALVRAGLRLLVLEQPLPGALRWGVAFAAAVVEGQVTVEGVEAVLCPEPHAFAPLWGRGAAAVWTGADPLDPLEPAVLIDARMRQLSSPRISIARAPLVLGIGPGFEAGVDVHVVVESNRGPRLGALVRAGRAEAHTGVPGLVEGHRDERVLRAPVSGILRRRRELGDFVEVGEVVAEVDGQPVVARLGGMIRGLKLTGVRVGQGHKVGDVDPRRDRRLLTTMTDKARAVGRGVLEAVREAGMLPSEAAESA